MMWRLCIMRSCRSTRLSIGPSGPRLVSISPSRGAVTACGAAAAVLHRRGIFTASRRTEDVARIGGRRRRPLAASGIRVVRMEGSKAQLDGRSVLMPNPITDRTSASRLSSPGRLVANASSPAPVSVSVEPADLLDLTDVASLAKTRRSERSGSSAPPDARRTRSPRRSAASRAEFGVRRPQLAPMPANRREQAISAIADLLLVQLERAAHRPAFSARRRGRVARRSKRQEEWP
jgi:hypothetical protein